MGLAGSSGNRKGQQKARIRALGLCYHCPKFRRWGPVDRLSCSSSTCLEGHCPLKGAAPISHPHVRNLYFLLPWLRRKATVAVPPPPSAPPFALLLLLSLFFSAEAQQSNSGPSDGYPAGYSRFSPSMAVLIVVLISAFFFVGFFSIYLRRCSNRADPSVRPAGVGARLPLAASRGLDPELIQTFPVLAYSDVKEHKIGNGGALECAVCLSEFDDDDTLRLLPSCDHVFHPDCIDAWLSAHTTCPVCRADLVPASGAAARAPVPFVSSAAAEEEAPPSAAVGADGGDGGERRREDAEGSPQVPQSDHVSITIDAPATEEPRKVKGRIPWRSKSSIRHPRFPRSHSTGHSLTAVQPGEDCERYTLRLPEHIWRDILSGRLQRSSSCAAFPDAGEGRTRKGVYGGGGAGGAGGSIGGRSFKQRRWEWVTKSDRWAFFTRTFSMRTPRWGGGAAEGEGSVSRGAGGGAEGSVKAKALPRGPFDCLGGGGGEAVAAASPKAAGAARV